MFSLPRNSEHPQDGSSDDQPIVLSGQDSSEFETFLAIVYPLYVFLAPFRHSFFFG